MSSLNPLEHEVIAQQSPVSNSGKKGAALEEDKRRYCEVDHHVGCIPVVPLFHGNELDDYSLVENGRRSSYWETLVRQSGFRGHETLLRADGFPHEGELWPHPWPPFVFADTRHPEGWELAAKEMNDIEASPGGVSGRRKLVVAWWDTFRRFLRARAAG